MHYTYDLRGLQTSVRFDNTSGQGILTEYDGFGRITQTTNTIDGKNHVIGSAHDAHGNRTSVTHPDGKTFTFEYDGLDRLKSLRDPTNAWLLGPGYDQQGRLASIYRNSSAIDTIFKYDTVGRLESLRLTEVSNSAKVRWDYTRNPASQIITETRDNDQYAFPVPTGFERDYTTNGLNQYVAVGSDAFCYDANGNLTSDGLYVYLYDFENRLVQMRLAVNANCAALDYSGAWRATFNYDTMGRLRIVNEGPNSTRFVHDGEALIVEYDGSDTLLRRYVHGSNAAADDPLVWYEGAGTARADRRYLHADPRGSIVLTADADGNTIAINAYDEYGIPTTSNNGFDITTRGRFRYTGQVWLPELGMYYYKARIYSPTLGRFLQTDPIGYEDQFNLYAYVGNDPINLTDFTGLAPYRGAVTDYRQVRKRIDDFGFGSVPTPPDSGRYFHTESFGWVDLRHFQRAAELVIVGIPANDVILLGDLNEVWQWAFEWGDDYRSGFSPEDRPSNIAGAAFGEYVVENLDSEKSIGELFAEWAEGVGAQEEGSEDYDEAVSELPNEDPAKRGNGSSSASSGSSRSPRSGSGSSSSGCFYASRLSCK